jgi:putative heme-binding domain-containing protein
MLSLVVAFSIALTPAYYAFARSSSEPSPPDDSPMVKLLKSKRVPEDRQGTIVDLIGKRGTADDLSFIYEQAIVADGFTAPVRVAALEALAGAAANRNLKPSGNLEKLLPLVQAATSSSGASLGKAAVRLAGLWKLEPAAKSLADIARSEQADESLRADAFDALATIGGKTGAAPIEALAAEDHPESTRLLAIAALAKLDLPRATALAAGVLSKPAGPGRSLVPLLRAFLDRQGGSDMLAKAIGGRAIPADSAKLALRAVYTLGRSDQALVDALSRAAGITELSKPLSPSELSNMVSEVAAKGDPVRGEDVFRRSDLNCMSCHSVSKAGGDVGPDLSAVGQISPPDYIINSILNPDLAIKEQYNTLVVLTFEGQVFQGIVTDKDEQRVVLKDATGATRVVPATSIEDQKAGGSLMPKGLANLMTRSEFLDLVRFLSELGKPGPYAIPPVPAIQCWKVFKAVSSELANSVPEGTALRDQILRAPLEKWDVAYAKVDGSLPLDEVKSKSSGNVFYLQGAIDVSSTGPVKVQADSAAGMRLWIDDAAAAPSSSSMSTTLSPGRHSITLRVDTAARPSRTIRVEVAKPAGSSAEFTVGGGH